MLRFSRLLKAWRGVAEMPFLLRVLCGGAMVACPLLLVALCVPTLEWDVDGRNMTHGQIWASGTGSAIAVFLVLGALGSWALSARIPASRWLLVSMPLAPELVLSLANHEWPPLGVLASAALTACGIWFCLFRLRSVKAYLVDGVAPPTSVQDSA